VELFIADPHFGHANIINLCNRPFSNVEEMDETMVDNWNSVVHDRDTVRVLGDFAFRCDPSYAQKIFNRLKGHKHLIIGNHDRIAKSLTGWESMHDLADISVEKQRIIMCHYPLRAWDGAFRGSWMLHGHCHNKLAPYYKSFDVGVDGHNFTPWTFDEVREHMKNLQDGSEF